MTRADAHERRRNVQRAVLAAAGRELLDEGEKVTLRAICARANFAPGAMYRYFPDMASLEWAIADGICTEVLAEIAAATGAVPEADLTGRVAATWAVLRQVQAERPRHYTFLLSQPTAAAALFDAIGEHIAALVDTHTAVASDLPRREPHTPEWWVTGSDDSQPVTPLGSVVFDQARVHHSTGAATAESVHMAVTRDGHELKAVTLAFTVLVDVPDAAAFAAGLSGRAPAEYARMFDAGNYLEGYVERGLVDELGTHPGVLAASTSLGNRWDAPRVKTAARS